MKTCIVYNRTSGTKPGSNLFQSMDQGYSNTSIDILESQQKGHNKILAHEAVQKGNRIIIAAGGDGTINEVINGLVGTNAILALIPRGTANDLASNIGMSSHELDILKNADAYHTQKIDLIRVNGRYFATVGGFGLASAAAAWANRVRKKMGWTGRLLRRSGSMTYLMSVMAVYPAYRSNPINVHVMSNHHKEKVEIFSLILANQPLFGRWFNIAPKASNTDGLLDVCLVSNTKNLFQSIAIVCSVMTGKHLNKSYVQYWQDNRLIINSEQPIAFFGDGEIFEVNTQFEVQLVPQALNILVPKSQCGFQINETT